MSQKTGRGRAEELFDQVRAAARMSAWPCRLRAGATARPVDGGNALLLRHDGPSAPCGTFRAEYSATGMDAVITYDPALVADPGALAATFAHELAHYLMRMEQASAPPGGWAMEEHLTDLLAVRTGFGLFLANSARSFAQFGNATQSGWSSRWQGYLSEGALVTATALCELAAGRDPMAAAEYLKPYLASDLGNAAKWVRNAYPDVRETIRAVDLDAFVRE